MKKILATTLFLMIALVASILVACRAVDKDNQFEMPSEELATLGETQAAEKTRETKKALVSGTDQNGAEDLSVPYQYGNMQSGNFMLYGDNQILFERVDEAGFLLYTLDLDTLEVQLLCQDPSCSHSGGSCVARNKAGNLEQYNGRIYDLNGTVSAPVAELKGDHFETILKGSVEKFWHSDGKMYVVTSDRALQCYENGSKEGKTIQDEYLGWGGVVYQNYIYATSFFDYTTFRLNLTEQQPKTEVLAENAWSKFDVDAGTAYYVDPTTWCLYSCDMTDFSHPTKLTEEGVQWSSINFDEDYVYMRPKRDGEFGGDGCHEILRMPKNEPRKLEILAELPGDPIRSIYVVPNYDKVFVMTESQTEMGNANYEFYAVDKDSGKVVELEFPEI